MCDASMVSVDADQAVMNMHAIDGMPGLRTADVGLATRTFSLTRGLEPGRLMQIAHHSTEQVCCATHLELITEGPEETIAIGSYLFDTQSQAR